MSLVYYAWLELCYTNEVHPFTGGALPLGGQPGEAAAPAAAAGDAGKGKKAGKGGAREAEAAVPAPAQGRPSTQRCFVEACNSTRDQLIRETAGMVSCGWVGDAGFGGRLRSLPQPPLPTLAEAPSPPPAPLCAWADAGGGAAGGGEHQPHRPPDQQGALGGSLTALSGRPGWPRRVVVTTPPHARPHLLAGPQGQWGGADYASFVLLLLSSASTLTHLVVGGCIYLMAVGRQPRAFMRCAGEELWAQRCGAAERRAGGLWLGMGHPFLPRCLCDAFLWQPSNC